MLEPLGRGGMGIVMVAFDPELDRRIALKLVPGDPASGPRILREARALAKLSHPNVVPVYDVGEHEGGVYMAMELVAGETLRRWLRQPRSWRDIVRMMVAAGRGLEAAHAAGVVHRDFKPGNVMVGTDGRARVLDFGLARPSAFAETADPASLVSLRADVSHGALVGTPAYMAPEQHDQVAVDARADQFAFCVTLHEALWGTRPFTGDGPELRTAIADQRILRPAGRRLPSRLRRIVDRGLAEDPERRFPSMTALLAELERVQRRRRRVVQAMVLVAALGIGSAATWMLRPQQTDAEPPTAVTALAEQARNAAAEVLFVYPPPDDPARATAYRYVLELEAMGTDEAEAEAGRLRAEFAATLSRVGDEYWDREGGVAFAIDYYAQALVFDPDDPRARERTSLTPGELATLRTKATALDFSEAELDAGAVLAALAQPDEDTREQAVARVRSRKEGRRALSTEMKLEALTAAAPARASAPTQPATRAVEPEPEPEPEPVPETADAAKPSSAPRPLSQARAPQETKPPAKGPQKNDPEAARQLVAAARTALSSRQHAKAETLLHQAIDADPGNASAAALLSDVQFDRGRYAGAVRWARRAVKLAPRTAAHHMRLGDALFKVLRYPEARNAYAEAERLGHPSARTRLQRVDAKTGK